MMKKQRMTTLALNEFILRSSMKRAMSIVCCCAISSSQGAGPDLCFAAAYQFFCTQAMRFLEPPPASRRGVARDEVADPAERLAPVLEPVGEQVPDMHHALPFLEGGIDA